MKKILLFVVLLGAATLPSLAQSTKESGKFSIGFDGGLPVGSASNFSDLVFGGDVKYALPVATDFEISLSAGYTAFKGKNVGGFTNNLKAIPVKAGGRYGFTGRKGFFGEAQFGAAFIQDGGGTAFIYSPGLGYAFDGGFEAGVRYEAWSKNGNTSQLGLRVAYTF